jgi:hypothetical protein
MKKYLLAVLLACLSMNSFAYPSEKIAAIVNKTPITERELLARKNMLIIMQNFEKNKLTKENNQTLHMAALDSLIEDILVTEDAASNGIFASDKDVADHINYVENSNKMKKGDLARKFSSDPNIKKSFHDKIRSQIVRIRLNNEVLARSVSVNESEVDHVAIKYAGKDAQINFKVYSTSSDDDKSYKMLAKLREKAKNCLYKPSKLIAMESRESYLNSLSLEEKHYIGNLRKNEFSVIEDSMGGLKLYQVCDIILEPTSKEDLDNMTNFIGNKKLAKATQKYIEKLKNKAYIKIFE